MSNSNQLKPIENIEHSLRSMSRQLDTMFIDTQNIKGTSQIKLTLKISPTNLGAVLQTFSRYDYTIDEIFSDDEISNQNQDRYDHLINYLQI